jgi:ATP-dependent Zn protease
MPQTSGAELANLVNESAIAAARERSSVVTWHHVELARDRLLLGKERTGFRATDDEWRAVAVHEAGHALAGLLFRHPLAGLVVATSSCSSSPPSRAARSRNAASATATPG